MELPFSTVAFHIEVMNRLTFCWNCMTRYILCTCGCCCNEVNEMLKFVFFFVIICIYAYIYMYYIVDHISSQRCLKCCACEAGDQAIVIDELEELLICWKLCWNSPCCVELTVGIFLTESNSACRSHVCPDVMQRDATLLRLAYIHGESCTLWRQTEQARARANYQTSYQLTQWIGRSRCAIVMSKYECGFRCGPMILKHIWETSKVFISIYFRYDVSKTGKLSKEELKACTVLHDSGVRSGATWWMVACVAMNTILSNGDNINLVFFQFFQFFQFFGHFHVDGRMPGLLDWLERWYRSARQWSGLGDAGPK